MAGTIVHEWIGKTGGAERVLDEFARLFPDAPIRVLWSDIDDLFSGDRMKESWLASTPLRKHKALALPLMLPHWRSRSLIPPSDWVLISSHLFAHHARMPDVDTPKLVYAHTPARYIWTPEHDDRGNSLTARLASSVLRPLDRRRAQEATSIAANSQFTRARIARSWERDAEVIYPPVDVAEIQALTSWVDAVPAQETAVLDALPPTFVLGASRLIPYKRLDVAIAMGAAVGMPVVIAGSGPDKDRLVALAEASGAEVRFLDHPSDVLLRALYERAAVFVFAAIEDFGIMPVEAMAVGTPVITANTGGTTESVLDGVSGAALESFEPAALREAFARAETCTKEGIRARARMFDREMFANRIRGWVQREAKK